MRGGAIKSLSLRDLERIDWDVSLHLGSTEAFTELMLSLGYAFGQDIPGDVALIGLGAPADAEVAAYLVKLAEARTASPEGRSRLAVFDRFLAPWRDDGDTDPERFAQAVAGAARALIGERVDVRRDDPAASLAALEGAPRFRLAWLQAGGREDAERVLDVLFSRRMLSQGAVLFVSSGWRAGRVARSGDWRAALNAATARHKVAFSDEGPFGPVGRKIIVHAVG